MVTAPGDGPIFPGGISVSGLSVYPWPAPDGICGGSSHVHLACTEAYVVVDGQGELQTLTTSGFDRIPLSAGSIVWFAPGTIHRAVNLDGRLRVMVLMQNQGLPEAGDAVLTFPPEVLADHDRYRAAAALAGDSTSDTASHAASHAADERAARDRRDLAITGFQELADAVRAGDTAPLRRFYQQAVALVAGRAAGWADIVRAGPERAVADTFEHVTAVRAGNIDHLLRATAAVRRPPGPDDRRFGMCGRLDTYDLRAGGPTG